MRRLLLAPLTVLTLALGACGSHGSATGDDGRDISLPAPDVVATKATTDVPNCPKVATTPVPGGMPAITLGCLGGGRAVDMAGLRGPMIVNFFASWCTACHAEMPALAAFARHQSAVKVLGIDFLDTQPVGALQLAGRSHVAYPLVVDAKGSLDRSSPLPHISAMPTSVFIDAAGKVVRVDERAYTSEAEVRAAAQQYLGTSG
ncbi:MAG TPA: TlpA disulfide reductase family protein [Nocardioides sp.]|jgi:thiol-disulfide isomerase/thioredoxin|uniref:TlpA disulfide reductase family protein n=1 Tax=Nocardioides sp. TaxID=35761 RepID=UPI002E3568BB|nr:TlpA disulfide reductase family protein [Nocardioides sp.]HEX3932411.1 TlpA disulfide reductase family protein [Nocardioides sp.]